MFNTDWPFTHFVKIQVVLHMMYKKSGIVGKQNKINFKNTSVLYVCEECVFNSYVQYVTKFISTPETGYH